MDFSVLYGINWGYSLALSWWLVWRIQNYFTQMSGVFMGNLEDWAQQSASPSLGSLRAFPCGLFSRVARLFNITVQVWTWESIPRDEAKSTSKVWVQKLAQQYFGYSTDQGSDSLPRFKGKRMWIPHLDGWSTKESAVIFILPQYYNFINQELIASSS